MRPNFSVHPVGKTMSWIKKMDGTFLMASTTSITMQSSGKIVQRAPVVGSKMWCLSLCFFFLSVTLRVPSAVRSRGAYFEQALRCHLQADLDAVYSLFSINDCSFSSYIRRQMAPQFSRICGQKLRKVQKSVGKCARTTSYRQLKDLKKILLQQFSAEIVDVHLYKFFSASRFLALTASVKFRISSPKTARNEQVCAHQKSYRKYVFQNLF